MFVYVRYLSKYMLTAVKRTGDADHMNDDGYGKRTGDADHMNDDGYGKRDKRGYQTYE